MKKLLAYSAAMFAVGRVAFSASNGRREGRGEDGEEDKKAKGDQMDKGDRDKGDQKAAKQSAKKSRRQKKMGQETRKTEENPLETKKKPGSPLPLSLIGIHDILMSRQRCSGEEAYGAELSRDAYAPGRGRLGHGDPRRA